MAQNRIVRSPRENPTEEKADMKDPIRGSKFKLRKNEICGLN